MNTFGQQFNDQYNLIDPETETIQGLETIFSYRTEKRTNLNLSYFNNMVDVIGWDGDENRTTSVGKLRLHGIEFDINQKSEQINYGLSLSYVKQLSWQLDDKLQTSGVSYSDYRLDLEEAIQTGSGNDLNNWPNLSIKLFGQYRWGPKWVFHSDIRYFSKFQGALDGLEGLKKAGVGTSFEEALGQSIANIEDEKAYQEELRANLAVSYQVSSHWSAQLFVINALATNGSKRYSYDTGNDDPHRGELGL